MHRAPVKKLMFNPQSTVEWWSNPEVPLFLVEQSGSPAFFEIRCAVKVNPSTREQVSRPTKQANEPGHS